MRTILKIIAAPSVSYTHRSALRHGSRFVKRKVREHPAKAVQRAESKYVKATADYLSLIHI